MPSPTETLFLVQLSPVPAQTIFGLPGSMVTAPIDCTDWLSKTGLNDVPPFTDFHIPPLADPTNTVMRPFSFTPSTAEIRPLIVADPILRAGSPEIVPASYLNGCCCAMQAQANTNAKMPENIDLRNCITTAGIVIFRVLSISRC